MIRLAYAAAQAAGCALLFVHAPVRAAADSSATPPAHYSVRWLTGAAAPNGKPAVDIVGVSPAALSRLREAGWPAARWQEAFSVFAVQPDAGADARVPAMLGAYRITVDSLHFEPQFPLEPGVLYRAVLRPNRLSDGGDDSTSPVTWEFRLPARAVGPATVVSDVFPSSDVLPENLLKFYLHFSAPMSGGHVYRHIHLRDDTGRDVELPFLELDEELWNPAMTRLTLLLDPGRIKRGVRPLEEIGGALQVGRNYTLVIDATWPDAKGQPLHENFRKAFKVAPADRITPNPATWKIQSPSGATREALEISFSKPMDQALALRLIRVESATGETLEGTPTLTDHERKWSFVPVQPWQSGVHRIVVATTIEDVAGNNIGKAFDVDLLEQEARSLASETIALPFTVK